MSKQIRLVGPFAPMTGYAKMARAALRSLLLAGYEVEAVESDVNILRTGFGDGRITEEVVPRSSEIMLPEEQERELETAFSTQVAPDAPTLAIQLPGNLSQWKQFANGPLIGWTMTESDNLCDYWKHGIRHTDMTLAPSRYVHETFKHVVSDVETRHVPIPVDPRLWSPDEYKEDIGRSRPPFLFLAIFSTCERKNWRVLMQAFAEEFAGESEKVGLLCKPSRSEEVEQMADWCREMGAWVRCDLEKRTDWTMGALYRACDIYLQPASEGLGLTFIEAAMCGLPSIALNKSGSADVVSERNGYLVKSHMQPIIGHMPQFYPRTHNFAMCGIDELRGVLRRAYTREMSSEGKGWSAQVSAKAFTCEAIAPKLDAAIQEGVEIAKRNRSFLIPPIVPKWAFVAGAWGDVFACAGNVAAMLKKKGMEQIGIIYYGRDPKIADWIQQQTWCREVIPLIEPDVEEMTRQFGFACQIRGHLSIPWLSGILDKFGYHAIDTDEVAFTQLRLNETPEPHYWKGARLSPDARLWAQEHAEEIGRPFYLLNPLSVASNKMRDHWRYWSAAITWLIEESENHGTVFALTGEHHIPWPEHPNLINLSGQSRSMQDVLALAERSVGMITTSNNLGIYAPIAGIPSVVVCARTCDSRSFYYDWMKRSEEIRLLDYGDAMPQFVAACRGLFGLPDETLDRRRIEDMADEAGVMALGGAR